MATGNSTAIVQAQQQTLQTVPLIMDMAASYKMSTGAFITTVKETLMPNTQASPAQLLAFLTVAHQYRLNPFTRQIFAFPGKGGGIVPMVPVDGWIDLVQHNEQYNGVEFDYHWDDGSTGMVQPKKDGKAIPINAITTKFHVKGKAMPTVVTEYFAECVQPNKEPWVKWPIRMLRHKSYIQCARVAFGFSGIYDEDEAERIVDAGGTVIPPAAAGTLIDGATGKPVVANMSAAANADVRNATQPTPTTQPTQVHQSAPNGKLESETRTESKPPQNLPATSGDKATTAPQGAAAGQPGQTSSVAATKSMPGGLARPDPDPFYAEVDRRIKGQMMKVPMVRGTVTALYSPRVSGKSVKMGLKMGNDDFSSFNTKHHAILLGQEEGTPLAKGQVCQFIYSVSGKFKNIEVIEHVGPAEWALDENGAPIRVLRRDEPLPAVPEPAEADDEGFGEEITDDGAPHPADPGEGESLV